MARESKTIQLYPNDKVINETVKIYEAFGWELISNQRCQENSGSSSNYDGSTTQYYKTFHKITFSREKASSWYSDVSRLENEYYALGDEYKKIMGAEPDPPHFRFFVFLLLLIFTIIGGVLYLIWFIVSKVNYNNKRYPAWQEKYSKRLKEIGNRQAQILIESEALVNAV